MLKKVPMTLEIGDEDTYRWLFGDSTHKGNIRELERFLALHNTPEMNYIVRIKFSNQGFRVLYRVVDENGEYILDEDGTSTKCEEIKFSYLTSKPTWK